MSNPFRATSFERLAGLFLLLTLAGGVFAVWVVVRGAGIFQDRLEYRALLPEAFGVAPGAPVKMRGLVAGRVESVSLTDDDKIEVEFSLEEGFGDRLHADAHVEVGANLGLSMVLGGAGLVVEPGTADERLEPGATLPVVAGGGLAALAPALGDDPTVADARQIVHNVRVLSDAVAEDGATVHEALAATVSLLVLVQDPDHSVGKFLHDEGETYDRIQSLLERADRTMGRVEPLMAHVDKTLDGADAAIARADKVLAAGGKTVEAMNPVLTDASKAMRNLDRAVGEFARATKSLITLVNDMNKVVKSLDATVRATQQIFPIRRHLKKQEEQ